MEQRKHGIGHTCITWEEADVETAVSVLAELGYQGVEVFGWTLDVLKEQGKLDLFEKNGIPLVSAYFAMNLCDTAQFEESREKGVRWARIMNSLGAKYICMGGEDVDRRSYKFQDQKARIIRAVDEYGRIFADMGLTVCYHPHTGTPVQTEEEIRTLMESVNPDFVSFAPDVAQIQKGGADPVAVVRDYIGLVKHIHLKDYDGVPVKYDGNGREIDITGFAGYTPLGEGVVDIPAVLDLIENSATFHNMIMVELDGGNRTPIPQKEAVKRNREYLMRMGYAFGSL